MFFPSLSAALAATTSADCQSLIAQGIKFCVAVENQRGKWFLLHADDQGHAGTLATHWVDVMGARGASARRIFPEGIAVKPFLTVFEHIDYCEEEAA